MAHQPNSVYYQRLNILQDFSRYDRSNSATVRYQLWSGTSISDSDHIGANRTNCHISSHASPKGSTEPNAQPWKEINNGVRVSLI